MKDARPHAPRVTVAANALPGVGGQGQNLAMMADALASTFDLTVLDQPQVPPPLLARAIAATPVLRRRRDWITTLRDRHFDRAVSARLTPCALFQGVTGQCDRSLATARRLGARTVLDSVTLHVDDFGAALDASCAAFGIRPALSPGHRRACRREYASADRIRVMSHVARRSFESRGIPPDRLFVVPPWLAMPAAPPPPHDAPFRVGFVGLLEPWKGFHYLIEAFGGLGLRGAELHILGGSGSRPVARYLRDATARWPGIQVRPVEVQHVGLAEAYGALSVLVHPSLADGFGLVVAEAMACGVPAIVTTAAGAADLIEDGVNGFLVPPGDRDAIADRLAQLARDPDLRHALGRAARRRAEQLTREAFLAAYLPELQRLVA